MPVQILTFLLTFAWILTPRAHADVVWHENKGKHFIVYEQERSRFSDKVLRRAEDAYENIVRYFGTLPKSDFWSWDSRCKIYLYRSRIEYMTATRQPEWSGGFANVRDRSVTSFANAPEFLDSVLPHEMAHLIFREFVKLENKRVPRWLDEGFAIAQEATVRTALDETVRRAIKKNEIISLRQLNAMSTLHEQPTESARLFYAQAQSVTRFLLKSGGNNFLQFCRLLRDGTDIETALRRSFQRQFKSIEDLEKKWSRHVRSARS